MMNNMSSFASNRISILQETRAQTKNSAVRVSSTSVSDLVVARKSVYVDYFSINMYNSAISAPTMENQMDSATEQITPLIMLHLRVQWRCPTDRNVRGSILQILEELVRKLHIPFHQLPRIGEMIILPMGLSDSDTDSTVTQISHTYDSYGRLYYTEVFCSPVVKIVNYGDIANVQNNFAQTAREAGFMSQPEFWELHPRKFL